MATSELARDPWTNIEQMLEAQVIVGGRIRIKGGQRLDVRLPLIKSGLRDPIFFCSQTVTPRNVDPLHEAFQGRRVVGC